MSIEILNLGENFTNDVLNQNSLYNTLSEFFNDPNNMKVNPSDKKLYGDTFNKISQITTLVPSQPYFSNTMVQRADYSLETTTNIIDSLTSIGGIDSYYFELLSGIVKYYKNVSLIFQDGFIVNNQYYTYNSQNYSSSIFLTQSFIQSGLNDLNVFAESILFNLNQTTYYVYNGSNYITNNSISFVTAKTYLNNNENGSKNSGIYIIGSVGGPNPTDVLLNGNTLTFRNKRTITVIDTINLVSLNFTESDSNVADALDQLVFNYYGYLDTTTNKLNFKLQTTINNDYINWQETYLYTLDTSVTATRYTIKSGTLDEFISGPIGSLSNIPGWIYTISTTLPPNISDFINSISIVQGNAIYVTYEYDKVGQISNLVETVYSMYDGSKINQEKYNNITTQGSYQIERPTTLTNGNYGLIFLSEYQENIIVPFEYPTVSVGVLYKNENQKDIQLSNIQSALPDPITTFKNTYNISTNVELSHIVTKSVSTDLYYVVTVLSIDDSDLVINSSNLPSTIIVTQNGKYYYIVVGSLIALNNYFSTYKIKNILK